MQPATPFNCLFAFHMSRKPREQKVAWGRRREAGEAEEEEDVLAAGQEYYPKSLAPYIYGIFPAVCLPGGRFEPSLVLIDRM